MRLLPKFLVPLFAVYLAILGYFFGVWMPKLHADAEAGYLAEISRHVDSVAEGLVPLMLSNQLDVIYENLDALKEKNTDWLEVALKDAAGRQLYPLATEPDVGGQIRPYVHVIERPVDLEGRELGKLSVTANLEPAIAQQRKHLFELGIVFTLLTVLLLVAIVIVLERMVLIPVGNLVRASEALARRNFSVPLPAVTKDEIGELVSAFAAMREARKTAEESLASSNKELEQFAYVISHDLREPLRMVSSFMLLLERRYADKLDKDGREFIGFAKDGAKRMDQMIVDLLEYSRAGRKSGERAPIRLEALLAETLRMMQVRLKEAKATITVGEEIAALPELVGYREELLRLLLNLLGNGLKYCKKDVPPQIAIHASQQGGEIVVSVADNGIGIEAQYFDRIFQIFQRLHSRDEYEGSGIGLATCKKIVEHHHGRIWLESVYGEGSTFFVALPVKGPDTA